MQWLHQRELAVVQHRCCSQNNSVQSKHTKISQVISNSHSLTPALREHKSLTANSSTCSSTFLILYWFVYLHSIKDLFLFLCFCVSCLSATKLACVQRFWHIFSIGFTDMVNLLRPVVSQYNDYQLTNLHGYTGVDAVFINREGCSIECNGLLQVYLRTNNTKRIGKGAVTTLRHKQAKAISGSKLTQHAMSKRRHNFFHWA